MICMQSRFCVCAKFFSRLENHFGGMRAGHYTSYCRMDGTNDWYHFDDKDVLKLTV